VSALLHFVAPDPWATLLVIVLTIALVWWARRESRRLDHAHADVEAEVARRRETEGSDLDFDWPKRAA
jgi:hypothetical protein